MSTAICERLEQAIDSGDLDKVDECLMEISPKNDVETFKANFTGVYKKLQSLEMKYGIKPERVPLSVDFNIQLNRKIGNDNQNNFSAPTTPNGDILIPESIKQSILAAYFKLFQMMNGVRTILKEYVDVCQKLVDYNFKLENIRLGVLKNIVTFINHMVKKDYTIEAKEFMYSANLIIDLAYRLSISNNVSTNLRNNLINDSSGKEITRNQDITQEGSKVEDHQSVDSYSCGFTEKSQTTIFSIENLITLNYISLTVEVLPLLECIKHMISFSKSYPSKIHTIKYFVLLSRLAYSHLDFSMYLNCLYRVLTVDKSVNVGYENLRFFRDVSDYFATNGEMFGNIKILLPHDAYSEIMRFKKENAQESISNSSIHERPDRTVKKHRINLINEDIEIIKVLYENRSLESAVISNMQDGRIEQKSFDCTIPFSFRSYRFLKINGFDFEIKKVADTQDTMHSNDQKISKDSDLTKKTSQISNLELIKSIPTIFLNVHKHRSISYPSLVYEIKRKCEMRQKKNIEKAEKEQRSMVEMQEIKQKVVQKVTDTDKRPIKSVKPKKKRPLSFDNFKENYLKLRVICDKTLEGASKTIVEKINKDFIAFCQDAIIQMKRIQTMGDQDTTPDIYTCRTNGFQTNESFYLGLYAMLTNSLGFVIKNLDSIDSEEDIDEIINRTDLSKEAFPKIILALMMNSDLKDSLNNIEDIFAMGNSDPNLFLFALLAFFLEHPEFIETSRPYLRPEDLKNLRVFVDKIHKNMKDLYYTVIDEQKINQIAIVEFLKVIIEQTMFFVKNLSFEHSQERDMLLQEPKRIRGHSQSGFLTNFLSNLNNNALKIPDHLYNAREKARASFYNKQACEISARKTILHEYKELITTNLFVLEEKIQKYRSHRNYGGHLSFGQENTPRAQNLEHANSNQTTTNEGMARSNIFERGSSLHSIPTSCKNTNEFESEKIGHRRNEQYGANSLFRNNDSHKESQNLHQSTDRNPLDFIEANFRGSSNSQIDVKNTTTPLRDFRNDNSSKKFLSDEFQGVKIQESDNDPSSILQGFKRGSSAQATLENLSQATCEKEKDASENLDSRYKVAEMPLKSGFESRTSQLEQNFRGSRNMHEEFMASHKEKTYKQIDSQSIVKGFRGSMMPCEEFKTRKDEFRSQVDRPSHRKNTIGISDYSDNTYVSKDGTSTSNTDGYQSNLKSLRFRDRLENSKKNEENGVESTFSRIISATRADTQQIKNFRGSTMREYKATNQRNQHQDSLNTEKKRPPLASQDIYLQKQAAMARESVSLFNDSKPEHLHRQVKDLFITRKVDETLNKSRPYLQKNPHKQSLPDRNIRKDESMPRTIEKSEFRLKSSRSSENQENRSKTRHDSRNHRNRHELISTRSHPNDTASNDVLRSNQPLEDNNKELSFRNLNQKNDDIKNARFPNTTQASEIQNSRKNTFTKENKSECDDERLNSVEKFSRGSRLHK